MREYLISVIGAVLICALLTSIIPNGKNAPLLRGIAKILCLSVIISPILFYFNHDSNIGEKLYKDFFSDSVIQTDQGFIDYYSEYRVAYLEEQIEREIFDKYQIVITAAIDWEYQKSDTQDSGKNFQIHIKRLRIKIEETIKEEERDIMWKFLTENYCSEVLIE